MAYYAKDDQISTSPLADGIEITQQQYSDALEAKLEGRKTEVRDNVLWIASTTKLEVYSTADGEALEIPDNDEVPEGYVAEPRPDVWHEWDGSDWVLDDEAFLAAVKEALKERRDTAVESSTVEITSGAIFLCDKETQDAVVKTFTGMQAAGMTEYPDWKAENGYYDLTLAQMQEAGVAIMQKVSQGFSAEKVVLDTHASTPFTSVEGALTAFTTAYNGG